MGYEIALQESRLDPPYFWNPYPNNKAIHISTRGSVTKSTPTEDFPSSVYANESIWTPFAYS
jgi:hypothetical protein